MGCGSSTSATSSAQWKDVKLTYFDLRGRAETIRLLLHYNGIQFQDKRVTNEEWAKLKPSELNRPLRMQRVEYKPKVPFLTPSSRHRPTFIINMLFRLIACAFKIIFQIIFQIYITCLIHVVNVKYCI